MEQQQQQELTLKRSLSGESTQAKKILKESGFKFTEIISDDQTSSPVLSDPNSIYPFRGLKNINIFIKSHKI